MTRTNDTARERQLERYLLGTLSDDEKDRLESALLADHDLFSELDASEGSLIDRYLEGDLASEERQLFEERLLPSQRVRDRVAMAGALQRLADQRARHAKDEDGRVVVPISPFQNQRPVPGRSTTNWLAWAACLVLMLATGYLAVLNVRLQGRFENAHSDHQVAVDRALLAERKAAEHEEALADALARLQNENADSSQLREALALRDEQISKLETEIKNGRRTPSNSQADEAQETILFLALATRAEENPTVLSLPIDGRVVLQLDLDRYHPPNGTRLQAVVERNGTPVWREEHLKPRFVGAEAMVPLVLPGEVLFPGSYTISITKAKPTEAEQTIGSYRFTADSK